MRFAALLAVAVLFGGCTLLTAREPLFVAADIQLASGLWAVGDDRECARPSSPDMRTWRACVQSLRVDADGVSLTRSPGAPQAEFRLHAPYAVSDGDPTLVRLGGPADVLGGAMGYHFAAFTDLRRNAQGQVIEARGKILLCPGADEVTSGIARSDDRCVARTLDALRRAAVLELRDDSDPPFRLRWMAALP